MKHLETTIDELVELALNKNLVATSHKKSELLSKISIKISKTEVRLMSEHTAYLKKVNDLMEKGDHKTLKEMSEKI